MKGRKVMLLVVLSNEPKTIRLHYILCTERDTSIFACCAAESNAAFSYATRTRSCGIDQYKVL